VEAARLGEARGELAEGERPGEHQEAAAEPESESQRRRCERRDELGRGEEDPDADRVAHAERGRRPEAGLSRGRQAPAFSYAGTSLAALVFPAGKLLPL